MEEENQQSRNNHSNCGAKVLIRKMDECNSPQSTISTELVTPTIDSEEENVEIFCNAVRIVDFPENQMEEDIFHDYPVCFDNDKKYDDIIDKTIQNVNNYIELRTSSYATSSMYNLEIECNGKVNTPPPTSLVLYANCLYELLAENIILKNSMISPKIIDAVKECLYQKPDKLVYERPTYINNEEMEERREYNAIPPLPEYYDQTCKDLGYKCFYDIEHPHPYRNPFDMFVYVNDCERIKLKSTNKNIVTNLSYGRLICLACAIIHRKEIQSTDKLQDWDIFDSSPPCIRRCCLLCKKNKRIIHYKHKKRVCTYCLSIETFSRYLECE